MADREAAAGVAHTVAREGNIVDCIIGRIDAGENGKTGRCRSDRGYENAARRYGRWRKIDRADEGNLWNEHYERQKKYTLRHTYTHYDMPSLQPVLLQLYDVFVSGTSGWWVSSFTFNISFLCILSLASSI